MTVMTTDAIIDVPQDGKALHAILNALADHMTLHQVDRASAEFEVGGERLRVLVIVGEGT